MKWLRTLRFLFGPRCGEISELSSRKLDGALPLAERLSRRLHFLTCPGCRRYDKQLKFLRRAFRMQPPPADAHLSEQARQRIASRVSEELKELPSSSPK